MCVQGKRLLVFGLLAIAAIAAAPAVVRAANTCNGLITIDYVGGPDFALPGDTVRVKLTLGTGSITGGSKLNVNRLRFDLDCDSGMTLGIPCTDEGMKVEYEGDSTITSNCGVTWATGHATSASPNEVVFTPNTTLMIPANQTIPPGFCNLQFDVKVLARSTDATPNEIEEVTGYLSSQNDAGCDNGLTSSGQQSSSIPLCPNCDDNIECSQDSCDQTMGTCVHTPQPTSTPCTDTDNDLCTTSGCNGTLATGGTVVNGCDQNHMVTTCADDNNPCTGPGVCNPMTGICAFPNLPDSTPCPDTDNDPCTTAGCDPNGVCDQAHIMCTTTTTTTIATTTTTITTTTTTIVTTTTTVPCVPTGPEAGNCGDMTDNDCNGLIDCADPACGLSTCVGGTNNHQPCSTPQGQVACVNGGGQCQCPIILKDPTAIKFGPPGAGLDQLTSHGRIIITDPVDVAGSEIGWLVSNARGPIYGALLPPFSMRVFQTHKLFTYKNPDALTKGGVYKAQIRITRYGISYGYKVEAYGDMSAATDPQMALQFYIGKRPTPGIHNGAWTRTKFGWVVRDLYK